MSLSGSCLCGAVRYTVASEPKFVSKCYCKDCQKESGAGHITVVAVPDSTVQMQGETRDYTVNGSSGQPVVRTFCPKCGATLFGRPKVLSGLTMIRAGTLDEAPPIQPSLGVYASRAPQWDQPPAGLNVFAEMPPPRSR
jgi:hypothetical protein